MYLISTLRTGGFRRWDTSSDGGRRGAEFIMQLCVVRLSQNNLGQSIYDIHWIAHPRGDTLV